MSDDRCYICGRDKDRPSWASLKVYGSLCVLVSAGLMLLPGANWPVLVGGGIGLAFNSFKWWTER